MTPTLGFGPKIAFIQ